MIYSVGRKDLYDRYFAADPRGTALKYGRGSVNQSGETLLGGRVFRTKEEAAELRTRAAHDGHERYILAVDADWVADTYQIEGEDFHRLTRDALAWAID